MKSLIILVIVILIAFLIFNMRAAESYNSQNSSSAGAIPAYAKLAEYGNYGPYGGAYNDFYRDLMLVPGTTGLVKRCAAGPYTYSSNSELGALCSTIPQDALDKVDCRRVERVRYTAPAFGSCGSYNSQLAPGYRVTGSPQLKYPVIEDVILL
jgi:hypothetical protein